MNYFDQIPMTYAITALVVTAILVVYALAKLLQLEEGVFPKLWKFLGRCSDFISGEISLVGHFLFGVVEEQVNEFFANERNLRNSAKLFKFLALSIMCLTFYASFNAITEFFMALGLPRDVSRTLAIANDTFIGLAVVYRMYHAFKGSSSMSGSIALFFFTALSFYFNIRHTSDGAVAAWYDIWAGGGLAPLGLFISVEFMSKVIESQTFREGAVRTDQQLAEQVYARRAELKVLEDGIQGLKDQEAKIAELQATRVGLEEDINYLTTMLSTIDATIKANAPGASKRIEEVRLRLESGQPTDEIAKDLKINPRTARSYARSAQNGTTV